MNSIFKKFANDDEQPSGFEFSSENKKRAYQIIKQYPKNYKESCIMPFLTLAQNQSGGWIPKKAMEYISSFLNVSEMRVLELATFYSMYNLSPIGKFHIEVCTTTPCMLRGAEKILEKCEKNLNLKNGNISDSKQFSISEVECLGACVNAPVAKIGSHYYEDLSEEIMTDLLERLKSGKKIEKGSQINRRGSEPTNKSS